ncbi:MAG: hypothetical protein ACI97A_003163 [Planctomycetota bacterium]|jgi:hypothetical protein
MTNQILRSNLTLAGRVFSFWVLCNLAEKRRHCLGGDRSAMNGSWPATVSCQVAERGEKMTDTVMRGELGRRQI